MSKIRLTFLLSTAFVFLPSAHADYLKERDTHCPIYHWRSPHAFSEKRSMRWFSESEQKIRQAGFTEEIFANKRITCTFRLTADGEIGEPKLIESSGSNTADQAALNLVKAASKLPQPLDRNLLKHNLAIHLEYPQLEIKMADDGLKPKEP